MKTLSAATPVATFTRKTNTPYTHVVVWNSQRAKNAAASVAANAVNGRIDGYKVSGVQSRWAKDQGYGVTWHGSISAARNASKKYYWDSSATLVGIFDVTE